jgi:hypothetical protein
MKPTNLAAVAILVAIACGPSVAAQFTVNSHVCHAGMSAGECLDSAVRAIDDLEARVAQLEKASGASPARAGRH